MFGFPNSFRPFGSTSCPMPELLYIPKYEPSCIPVTFLPIYNPEAWECCGIDIVPETQSGYTTVPVYLVGYELLG